LIASATAATAAASTAATAVIIIVVVVSIPTGASSRPALLLVAIHRLLLTRPSGSASTAITTPALCVASRAFHKGVHLASVHVLRRDPLRLGVTSKLY
jgi:hypothetical protein